MLIYIFRGDVNKLINIISEAKLIKTFDDKDRLIVDKFVLFKNDTDKGIVIANKDLYATEVVDIGEDWIKCDDKNDDKGGSLNWTWLPPSSSRRK